MGGTDEDMELLYEDPKAANNLEDEMVGRPFVFCMCWEGTLLMLRFRFVWIGCRNSWAI